MIIAQLPDARLCADPRPFDLPSGTIGVSLRVASNYRTKRDGEWTYDVMFLHVTIFRGTATIIEHFKKGDPITVWGQLIERKWNDRDGQPRVGLELAHADWSFPPRPRDELAATQEAEAKQTGDAGVAAADDEDDDGIPF